jgi:hypothetical protein
MKSMKETRVERGGGGKIGARQMRLLGDLAEAQMFRYASELTDPEHQLGMTARQMHGVRANIRCSLRGLERRGLVRTQRLPVRLQCHGDLVDTYRYYLTERGRRIGQAEVDRRMAEHEAYMATLSPEQRAEAKALVEAMRKGFETADQQRLALGLQASPENTLPYHSNLRLTRVTGA